jgi:hydrogenase/urease accessory protein HupE
MFRISRVTLAASLILLTSGPALAHPGHGPDNPFLHRLVHWASGVDPMLAALCGSILALVVAVALLAGSRRAKQP